MHTFVQTFYPTQGKVFLVGMPAMSNMTSVPHLFSVCPGTMDCPPLICVPLECLSFTQLHNLTSSI